MEKEIIETLGKIAETLQAIQESLQSIQGRVVKLEQDPSNIHIGGGHSSVFAPEDISTCLHDHCPSCNGTGKKSTGEMCVHGIACSCPKCSPSC